MRSLQRLILAVALIVAAPAAFAEDFKVGDITVSQPWSRATPAGAEVAAGFMTITNGGPAPDRLVAASSDVAHMAQIHEMSMQNGVMEMKEVEGGLEIPAGGGVKLEPKSYHIMLMHLAHPLKEGDTFKIELTFAKAGKVTVDVAVGGIGASQAPGS
ncbi:MAG TPA: copper chaperone PCu(A)C [Dongiaceae bacterium]|jgi:copper(I)-binding protein|nr:copper chaperone PCu(A)C [Dongiaceae bacterium]